MNRKQVEGLMFTLASIESVKMTVSEQLLASITYNALSALLQKLEGEVK